MLVRWRQCQDGGGRVRRFATTRLWRPAPPRSPGAPAGSIRWPGSVSHRTARSTLAADHRESGRQEVLCGRSSGRATHRLRLRGRDDRPGRRPHRTRHAAQRPVFGGQLPTSDDLARSSDTTPASRSTFPAARTRQASYVAALSQLLERHRARTGLPQWPLRRTTSSPGTSTPPPRTRHHGPVTDRRAPTCPSPPTLKGVHRPTRSGRARADTPA